MSKASAKLKFTIFLLSLYMMHVGLLSVYMYIFLYLITFDIVNA